MNMHYVLKSWNIIGGIFRDALYLKNRKGGYKKQEN
jgi:hypothetical protein